MSDDPTKDLEQKHDTKPTLETVVMMIRELRDDIGRRFDAVDARLDSFETRLERAETLLDRLVSVAFETRADVRDLKKEVREHFPAVQ